MMICRQCGRDVDNFRYDQGHRCCLECRAARAALYRHWQAQGQPLARHKPKHTWLVWESDDAEAEEEEEEEES